GIALKLLARQGGQAVGAASEVHRLRRDRNPHTRRNRDHVAAFTTRNTVVSVAASMPGATRTVAAPIMISIAVVSPLGSGPIGASDLRRASSTTTGAKAVPRAAPSTFADRRLARRRASRRQPKSC